MKILVFGSGGFIGKSVVKTLSKSHEVYGGDRASDGSPNSLEVDLVDQGSVVSSLNKVRPDIIINCAGTVENSEKAYSVNPIITMNILQAAILTKLKISKVIISGSAGEYGIVAVEGPVSEETPLMGTSYYARSKVLESSVALAFSDITGIPVVVTRIFNPIGLGMHPRFLLPNLIKQAGEIKAGKRKRIELSRLDAKRDYINVLDIAEAIKLIAENDCPNRIYNIGSGKSITNEQLMNGILKQQDVSSDDFNLIETSEIPEPNYAVQADISKMHSDFGWAPKYDINTTIEQVGEELAAKEKQNA